MKIVFMGSAELSCLCLDALLASDEQEVCAVITQPDRPKGRKRVLQPSLVKRHVAHCDIPVWSPENVNLSQEVDRIRSVSPDILVVVAYGQLLKSELLDLAPHGCVNVHASLLPRYRGAAPIQMAIADGCSETGVSIMHMDEGMDTGDVILQSKIAIGKDENAGELHARLGVCGAESLLRALSQLSRGTANREVQEEAEATYAPKLTKADGRIDWSLSAAVIADRVRGFNPWPMCACEVNSGGKLLRVLRSEVVAAEGAPGHVVRLEEDGPVVVCGTQGIKMLEVQPEGRTIMDGRSYVNGHSLKVGDVLR